MTDIYQNYPFLLDDADLAAGRLPEIDDAVRSTELGRMLRAEPPMVCVSLVWERPWLALPTGSVPSTWIEMDEHPGIVFRSGPAGRRPGLSGGPDVWEVIAIHRSFDDRRRTADWLDQPAIAIEVAFRYYETHRAEIDEWIRRNEETAEAAERVARARQAASCTRA